MKKWKIAIVGAGYMAGEHAKAFASLPDVSIVGVCGRTRERAEALAAQYAVPAFATIDAMYTATKADAVVVAVNELSMSEVYPSCFRYPWVCFVEKPIGLDLTQAEAILDSSRRLGARTFVSLNRRSYAASRQAQDELAHDEGPRLISVLDQQDLASARASGQPEPVLTNYMFANSIHLIDYFCAFGRGKIEFVAVSEPWRQDQPGFVVATIRFSSGDCGVYQAVWNGPGPWSVTITNRSVRVELRPLEKLGIQRRGERQLTEVALDSRDKDFKPGLRYQAEQLVRLLTTGQTELTSIDEAVRSTALCAEIYGLRSAKS
ncbi:Gfo/Idh/MocA family protein [Bradyrhizobium guangdongense]